MNTEKKEEQIRLLLSLFNKLKDKGSTKESAHHNLTRPKILLS